MGFEREPQAAVCKVEISRVFVNLHFETGCPFSKAKFEDFGPVGFDGDVILAD